MFFDARMAKLLANGEHLIIDGCPGLRLEARATRKSWVYRYKDISTGRMKQTVIGQWPTMGAAVAAAEWLTLKEQRSAGLKPTSTLKAHRTVAHVTQAKSVNEVVQDYIHGHLLISRKEEGGKAAQAMLEHLLADLPDFASQDAAQVNRSVAFAVIDSKKATPTVAAKLRSLLGAAWDYALDSGELDAEVPNWWRVVQKGRLKSKGKIVGGEHQGEQTRHLRDAEVAFLLNWLPNMHANGRDAAILYLWTGARGSEFLQMRPEHVRQESDGWWFTLPKRLTKNAAKPKAVDFRVPLVGRALEVVQRRLSVVGESGWLFESGGEQYQQKTYSTYINSLFADSAKAKRRTGEGLVLPMAHWSPHDLRRTARTKLAALGCPEEIGEALLGHLPAQIVGTYNAYSYDKERRHWLTALDAHWATVM